MDIVVLGGGIVGLTVANLLARNSDINLTLIDPQTPQLAWNNSEYDKRCSAIAASTRKVFESIGIWQDIINERVGIYNEMLIWDQDPQVQVHFTAAAISTDNLGHIVENRIVQKALYNKLSSKNNVDIVVGSANDLEQHPNFVRIHVSGRHIECKLVIGADGINSWLRNKVNIDALGWDYKHSSLVATIKSQLPHNNTARQRFMPDGPLAFLPLDDQYLSSIVWSSDPNKIKYLMQLEPQEFCKQLAAEFAFTLGDLELHGGRADFPLRMLHSNKYVSQRIALVGDAAHVIHPLAGQGLNLGVLDAAALADILQQAYLHQYDFGKLAILRKYERNRKSHNISMLALIEAVKQMFAINNKAFTKLRFNGMHCINNLNFVKNTMMHFAMGL